MDYTMLIRETVEATLAHDGPMSVPDLDRAVSSRLGGPAVIIYPSGERFLTVTILRVLQAHPDRFVELRPGVWARRRNDPDAGVRSLRPRHPLAGGAAAAAVPPEPTAEVDAVAQRRLAAG